MALALANDGQLMVADSGTGPRQQMLFYDITDSAKPKLTRAFGERGGVASGIAGTVVDFPAPPKLEACACAH